MARKNVYIRDADLPVWEQAESLSDNESFSVVITEALRRWVEDKQSRENQESFENIELEISTVDTQTNYVVGWRKVSFKGRELVTGDSTVDGRFSVDVYETAKHQVLFYISSNSFGEYRVYPNLQKAANDKNRDEEPLYRGDLIASVAEALESEWIEILDV